MNEPRVNPPAWSVKEDPSDLPRVLRRLEAAYKEGKDCALAELDVAVLVKWIRELTASREPPSSSDGSSR